MIICVQSYVVPTPHHTILVDSCVGNDKPRPIRPKWDMKTDDIYIRALAAAGLTVGDIDFVMCTHMHVDQSAGTRAGKRPLGADLPEGEIRVGQ